MLGRSLLVAVLVCLIGVSVGMGASENAVFRIGIIGLDTSHVTEFTKVLNDSTKGLGCKVVAGYPGGSADIESSASRVKAIRTGERDTWNMPQMRFSLIASFGTIRQVIISSRNIW